MITRSLVLLVCQFRHFRVSFVRLFPDDSYILTKFPAIVNTFSYFLLTHFSFPFPFFLTLFSAKKQGGFRFSHAKNRRRTQSFDHDILRIRTCFQSSPAKAPSAWIRRIFLLRQLTAPPDRNIPSAPHPPAWPPHGLPGSPTPPGTVPGACLPQ